MPSYEPSPHILTERSASFNRAEFNKSMRSKASNTDSTWGVESIENLTSERSSIHHIRHSSLDSSHPSALHPINLNSKFDYLFSPLWPAKATAKVSVDQAEKESGSFLASDIQKETGGETQEELILDPHESLLQDAQEESFSASMSTESKSPREDLDFILWGNAAFCLSEARDSSTCNKALGLRRKTERPFGESLKKQNNLSNVNNHHHLRRSRDKSPLSSASDRGVLPCNNVDLEDHLIAPTINAGLRSSISNDAPIAESEESLKCQSSVGSSLSAIHDSSTQRNTHAQAESSAQKPLMSSEAQSYCLDFDAQDMEVSAASNTKMPVVDSPQERECVSNEFSKEGNEEEVENIGNQQATHTADALSSQSDKEVHQDFSFATEEVKIRAELELEIEKDLEQEIKTKIYLLSRRLEELHVLKATRHPNQEQSGTQIEVGSCIPSNKKEEANTVTEGTREAPLPISPPEATIEQSRNGSHVERMSAHASSASSKKQLPNVEKDGLLTHANTPFANWRKFAMASGWAPHTKEIASSDGGLRNIKISKNSIDGLTSAKPKVQVEGTPSFKQDYQIWPVNRNVKKFDWIRTLRSDVACTPRLSSMKSDADEVSPFLPPSKEPLHGSVARTLFTEEGLSGLPRKTSAKTERREGLMTPLAGSLKRSAFSSSKPLVASTPRVRSTSSGLPTHDSAIKSASAKRLASQKPQVGMSSTPLHKTPDLRQARITTTSIPRVPPQQALSSKLGKTEKTSIVEALTSPTRSLKNNSSPTHTEKVKRSASAPPSVPARSVNSKDRMSAATKTLPNKQVSSLLQTRASRIAPSPKPAPSSSSQISKGRITVPSDNVGKRPSITPSKPTRALATRGNWH